MPRHAVHRAGKEWHHGLCLMFRHFLKFKTNSFVLFDLWNRVFQNTMQSIIDINCIPVIIDLGLIVQLTRWYEKGLKLHLYKCYTHKMWVIKCLLSFWPILNLNQVHIHDGSVFFLIQDSASCLTFRYPVFKVHTKISLFACGKHMRIVRTSDFKLAVLTIAKQNGSKHIWSTFWILSTMTKILCFYMVNRRLYT